MTSWIDQELAGCEFADARLAKKFKTFVEQLSEGIGETIPMACQDWANTKAAYRFLSNERVSESDILAGHAQSTRDRFRVTSGFALVVNDTSEFSFQRERSQLAYLLDDHAESFNLESTGIHRLHGNGMSIVRSPGTQQEKIPHEVSCFLHHKSCASRRLPRSCQRLSTRQHRHVARPRSPHRYRNWV